MSNNVNKKGVFVSSRNADSFFEKIDYIMNNYDKIQSESKKNILPEKIIIKFKGSLFYLKKMSKSQTSS